MDDNDNELTPHQKKTGRVLPGATSLDSFTVRQALPTMQAVQAYDKYLKEHKRRLRQLEKLARGELTPSEDGYT